MRKLQKTCELATTYKQWQDNLENSGQTHPAYNSSKGQYYVDIIMNLFHCQGGLCAYTESLLCAPHLLAPEHWIDGKYDLRRVEVMGQLEHFDKTLKGSKGWLWDNFFMVDSDINTKIKGSRSVDPILKPDTDDYDPFVSLEYDIQTNIFIANLELDPDVRQRITIMIVTLGINQYTIRERRRRLIVRKLKEVELGVTSWEDLEVDEFPTAFEMVRRMAANQVS